MTINFYLHDRNAKKSTIIFLHFRYPKDNLLVFSTKQKINPKQWNFKKKRAKLTKTTQHLSSLNSLLNKIENEIQSIYRECITSSITPSNGYLRQTLNKVLNFDSPAVKIPQNKLLSFLDHFDLYISTAEDKSRLQKGGKIISHSTIKNYKAVRKHIYDIQRLKDFKFKLTDVSFLHDHEMHEIKKYYKKLYKVYSDYLYDDLDCFDNTVGKRLKVLKSFFNYIVNDKGINLGGFYNTEFFAPKEEIPILVISPEQLHYLIYDQYFNSTLPEKLSYIRDLFVFGCTVALRISDLVKLTEHNITRENGCTYLVVKSQKTKTQTKVKLPFHLT